MESTSGKRVLFVFCFALLILILFVFFCYNFYQKKAKELGGKQYLNVRFETSDVIGITNRLPVSDAIGKIYSDVQEIDESEGYVRFSIQNTSTRKIKYQIILTKQVVDGTELHEKFIKCYLTDENDVPMDGFREDKVLTYQDFKSVKSKESSKIIYSGSLLGESTQNLRLRLWLSDDYRLSDQLESFRVDVDVKEK